MTDFGFYRNKKILITGHTGFKGTWVCQVLKELGAQVAGYALQPPTQPSLFEMCGLGNQMCSIEGDIRDLAHLHQVFEELQPEIVIHMAAQPIVRESYRNPVHTYEVNVMGTVNLLECVRLTSSVRSVVNVTTDKVYRNREWEWGYRENEELNGYDPYSNSKSCSELVTSSYINSFLSEKKAAVSTVRAGNVIGGGDFAADRIIPDCIRAIQNHKDMLIHNPNSTRPYQHVLEPVFAYLMIAAHQYEKAECAGSYNVGPDEESCLRTCELVEIFRQKWNKVSNEQFNWNTKSDDGPHEANYLKLDCSKIKEKFGWKPRWKSEEMIDKTVEWLYTYYAGFDISKIMKKQIQEYMEGE